MGLKLTLKAGERFVVNGAVLVNGERRGVLVVENHAAILRERDIMQPAAATTPAARIYFALMCAYLDPAAREQHLERFTDLMADFAGAILNAKICETCGAIGSLVLAEDFYPALMKVRELMNYEAELMGAANVDDRVHAGA